jgi:hypothetical protein
LGPLGIVDEHCLVFAILLIRREGRWLEVLVRVKKRFVFAEVVGVR